MVGCIHLLLLLNAHRMRLLVLVDYRNYRSLLPIFCKGSMVKEIIKKHYIFRNVAPDEQHAIPRTHQYMSDTKQEYRTCFLCKVRKSMICIKCSSCFLCHPTAEILEARTPDFYTIIGKLFDIECPALAEIMR